MGARGRRQTQHHVRARAASSISSHGLLGGRIFWQEGWLFSGEKGLFRPSWIFPLLTAERMQQGSAGAPLAPGMLSPGTRR